MKFPRILTLSLILASSLIPIRGVADDWRTVPVPGAIEASDTAWLRCWVKVHDSFFTRHDRNLFEESVGINLSDLPGAHEVWVNGQKIGSGGAFPPDFVNAEGEMFRHKVPAGTLRQGEWNEIAIRVHQPGGSIGFRGEAPFIMNYFWECVFEGEWELSTDADYEPGGALAEKPERATFDEFRESQRVLGRAEQVHGPSLPPLEAAAAVTAHDGLQVELLLHEPEIAQPFHFSFDERGRLWVAQCRQYPYPAGLTMVSRDRYYRAHYDRIPDAPPNHDRGDDIISIHEDTNGDGVYDSHKVFVDGLNMANAVVRGRGGVWIMHTPYLLFYPDEDGDDVPDGPPVVHLSGFGFEDSHAMANGLVWGPDGWLYGGQGSTSSCRVLRPGIDPPDAPGVYFEGCMVWRYHPETRAFEIFAEGSGNTFGLEFDAEGRLYSGHNGGDTRGWHYVQGGFYLMQGVNPGKFGPPRNPYAFGDLPMMAARNTVVRFTHFGAFADGTAIPSELSGLLFALDPLHNEIIATKLLPRGATFETEDHGVVVESSDPAFRPVYIANAPDGSLHVADMYEFYIAHGQHYQNQINPTAGRLYRVSGENEERETDYDLSTKSTDELVALLGHANKWHRHTAGRVLGERRDPAATSALKRAITGDDASAALNSLWALYQSAGLDEESALVALRHPHAPVRLWTARFLGDDYGVQRNLGLPPEGEEERLLPDPVFKALLEQARREPHAEVRSQLASTARRLPLEQGFPLVAAVMEHGEDVDDPYIPLLCWWVFEAHIPESTGEVMAFFEDLSLWEKTLVTQEVLPRLARRFSVESRREDLLRVAALLRLAPGPEQAESLMAGFEEAYRGRTMTALPEELLAAMEAAGGASLGIRLRQGDEDAVREALALVADENAENADRLRYARSFGEVRRPEAVPVLLETAESGADPELRRAAFASLGAYDEDRISAATLKMLPQLPEAVRPAALALLASRTSWTEALLAALQSGSLSPSLVSGEVAEQLRLHRDDGIREAALALFPKEETPGYDFDAKMAEIEAALAKGPGSPYAGEAIYMERCAACHKLFFKGGHLGPDLTSYQRDDLGTMLTSIVNPDAEIREGYQFITVTTKDGRAIGGFQVDRDNQVTVVRGPDGQDVTLAADEIEEVLPMGRSLMPAGLLDDLDEQQLRDFFAYLRISQPISN